MSAEMTYAEWLAARNKPRAPDPRDAEIATLRADLAASQAEVGRLLGFLHRAFLHLNDMAGEGWSFAGLEDPADILSDYAQSVGMPNDDMETILSDVARRAVAPAP